MEYDVHPARRSFTCVCNVDIACVREADASDQRRIYKFTLVKRLDRTAQARAGCVHAAIDMLEQETGGVVVAVIYKVMIDAEARISGAIAHKGVGSMIVGLVKYVTAVVIVVFGHGVHRPASHQAIVVSGKQPHILPSKICCLVNIAMSCCGVCSAY